MNKLLFKFFTLIIGLALFKGAEAQINYTRSTFTGAYAPISTGTGATAMGFGGSTTLSNTQTLTIPLPFSITYNGASFTNSNFLAVGINGFAYFTLVDPTTPSTTATNTSLYTTTAPNNTLAPWYDDLDLDINNDNVLEGSILQQLVAPNELVIQWTDVWSFAGTTGSNLTNNQINFQIRLYGSAHATKANQIEFIYGSVTGAYNASESASIGIENATGGPGNYLDAITNSKFVSNSMMNTKMWPKQHFRFTPSSSAPTPIAGGTYTVGTSGTTDYPSLSAVFADLNSRGISGNVIFNLTDALYDVSTNTFPLVLGPVVTSATNRITIQSNLSGGSVLSSVGGAGSVGTETATAVGEPSVIVLAGSDYVKLQNLTLQADNNNGLLERGLVITNASAVNGANYDSIVNVTVRLNRTNTSSVGLAMVTATAPTIIGGANSNNKFLNVKVYNSYAGILFSNTSTATNNFIDNQNEIGNMGGDSTIIGDTITDDIGGAGSAITYGIRATQQSNLKIHHAIVRNIGANSTVTIDGIWTDGTTTTNTSCEIYSNKVYNIRQYNNSTTGGVLTGIRVYLTNHASSSSKIYNNFITGLNSASPGSSTTASRRIIGINATGPTTAGSPYVHNIDFNTVVMNPEQAVSSNTCLQIAGPTVLTTTYNVRNNIFANYTGSQTGIYKHYCWVTPVANSIGTGSISNNNVLYIANPDNGFVGLADASDKKLLADWKTVASSDAQSRSDNPRLISLTDYKIDPLIETPAESAGSFGAVTWANNDIEGAARNTSTPDIGAKEGTYTPFFDDDMTPSEFAGPVNMSVVLRGANASPVVRFKNRGVNTQTNVTVRYRVIGPLPASTIVYNQTATIASLTSGSTILTTFPAGSIAANGTYSIEAITELAADNFKGNDTIRAAIIVMDALSGTIPVGNASQYPFNTLTNAVFALNSVGVAGPATLSLTDALYDANEKFPIEIIQFAGASSTNTLTIKPATGVTAAIKGRSLSFMLKLTDADYVTVDGSNTIGGTSRDLSIINDSVTTASGSVWISSSANGATYNTIKNCIIKAGTTANTGTFGIYAAGTTVTVSGTGANNDNLTIQNNLVQRAYRGIYTRGTAAGLLNNTIITQNEVGSNDPAEYVLLKGIDVTNSTGIEISKNKVYNLKPSSADAIGIELGTNVSIARVCQNTIDSVGSTGTAVAGAYGIALTSTTGIDSILIYNNFVTDILTNASNSGVNTAQGIRLAGGSRIYVDNNSVNLRGSHTGTSTTTHMLSAALAAANVNVTKLYVRNNILVNKITHTLPASRTYAIYTLTGVTLTEVDNNVYFTSGSNSALAHINGFDKSDMNQLRDATGQDMASIYYDVPFTSVKNLHIPAGTPSVVESIGKPLAHVTTDIDGNPRAATPDVGADEFNGTRLDASGPGINYFIPTKTSIFTNLSFTATIGDNSGINTTTAKPRVYYKKSTDANTYGGNVSFVDGWKYAEATNTASPFNFTIDYSLLQGGSVSAGDSIQYFVVAEDLAPAPNVGVNGVDFLTIPTSVALSSSDFPVTTKNYFKITPPIGDTVYVGTGRTFTSLTNTGTGGLFQMINNGVVVSNTTVMITSDLNETGAVALNEFIEEGAGNYTITFRSDSAVRRVIRGSVAGKGLITLLKADRITFDGRINGSGNYLTLVNGSTGADAAVFHVKNEGTTASAGSENITIRNCNIVGGLKNQSSDGYYDGPYGIVFSPNIGATYGPDAAYGNSNISIIQNNFNILCIGVYANTNSTTPMYNAVIDSNFFGHASDDSTISSMGMRLNTIPDGRISHNTFHNFLQNHPTFGGTITGLDVWGQSHRANISYNKFSKFRNYKASSITGLSTTSGDSVRIHNNIFEGFESTASSGTNSVVGLNFSSTAPMLIYHNTFHLYKKYMAGTAGASCIYVSVYSTAGIKTTIRNNIFVNTMIGNSTGKPIGADLGNAIFGSSDYNNFYVPNGDVAHSNTAYTTFAAWQQGTGGDQNSMNVNPQFNSDSNVVLLPTTPLAGKGIYLPAYPVDITGSLRTNPPTMGPYDKPADATNPLIVYNKLVNTTVNTQRTLNNFAVITDVGSAVDTITGRKPRIYFKRKTDENNFHDNTASTTGWKFAEANNNASPFNFVMDYNKLFGGAFLSTSDTIQYFVVAQDTATIPNVGANMANFASKPSSVNLTSTHFPVYGNINYYLITTPISGVLIVGPGGYPSLTDHGGAFELLNNSAISGPVELLINSNTLETGIHSLQSLAVSGNGTYSVRIVPAFNVELSGNTSTPLIRLDGADRVVIDGGFFGMKALTITNNGSGSVLEISNQSNHDTITNVIFKGNTSLANEGLLSIKNNCDSLLITGNQFTHVSSLPYNAIYSGGTAGTNDGIQVVSNEISNFKYSGVNVAATGNGSNWKIKGNHFYYNHTTAADTSQAAINFLAGALSENDSITGNTIGGQAISAAGNPWINTGRVSTNTITFKGISFNAGTSSTTVVSNNIIRNIKLAGATAMTFTGIEQTTGGGNSIIQGNIIGDSSNTDSIVIYSNTSGLNINYGIFCVSANPRTITKNKIWGLSTLGVLNNNLAGISVTGNGKPQVTSNIIHNLFSAGSDITETAPRAVTGIFSGSDNKEQVIAKNQISKLISSAGGFPGSAPTLVRAILANSTGAGGKMSQNRIDNLENLSTGNGELHGIYFFTGGSNARWTIDNNVMLLTNGSGTNNIHIEGVHDRNAAANREIALINNTIYIGGTVASGGSAGSACYQRSIASSLKLENNLFYNERSGGSGKHVTISNLVNPPTANWFNTSSNYNLFVAADTASIIEWGAPGTVISPNNYKVDATSDQFSYFASNVTLPSFSFFNSISNGDLSINPYANEAWAVNGKGKAIDTLGYSFDDSLRSVTLGVPVDIGAYEFTPSSQPPVVQNFSAGSITEIIYLTRKLATITYTGGTAPYSVDVQYFSGVTPPSAIAGKKINSYTSMSPQGGSTPVFNISYAYSPAEISNVPQANLKLARTINNGNSYVYYSSSVVNTTQFTVTANGITDFGIFTLTDQSNPLPVNLTAFTANTLNNDVLVSWTTASENNTAHFIVEVSTDGNHFEQAGKVKANGNSSSSLRYQFTHADARHAMNGASSLYYRLVSVDNDGYTSTSKTALVAFDQTDLNAVIYPNPFNNAITVELPAAAISDVTATIFDLQGRTMKTREQSLIKGLNTLTFDNLDELKSGVYFIRLQTGSETKTVKIVKQ